MTVLSVFNRDELCLVCGTLEKRHPAYQAAFKVWNVRGGSGLPPHYHLWALEWRPKLVAELRRHGQGWMTQSEPDLPMVLPTET